MRSVVLVGAGRSIWLTMRWTGALLCGLLLCSGLARAESWADPGGRFTLELAQPWVLEPGTGTPLVEGQVLRAGHSETGGGFVLRHLEAAPYLDVKDRRAKAIDIDAAMSPDRFALLLSRAPDETPRQVAFIGPADGVSAALGRWVFRVPASDGEPDRVWWHVVWRSEAHFHQLVAWVPTERFDAFDDVMRELEGGVRVTGAAQLPALLFDAGRDDCGAPLMVDRAEAIRGSRRFEDARALLRAQVDQGAPVEGLPTGSALDLAAHRAMGALYRSAEACVHRVARELRVCSVIEGTPGGTRSLKLQEAVSRCMDDEEELEPLLQERVRSVWEGR